MIKLFGLTLGSLLFVGAAVRADAPQAAPAKLSAADVARRAQAVAAYAGGEITVGELEDTIAQQSPFMRARYKDPSNLKELLDKTLRFSLLSDEAARRGFHKSDAVIQSVKQNAVQQLMKADFDDEQSAATIPKTEAAKYYQEHLDEYVQPTMQRASHIVVATEAEAKALLAQAKTMDLRAFREAARDKSTDEASKLRGGDLRYFDASGKARGETDSSVPAPIVKAAFALKTVGDTAPSPVKVPGGYSIVKLTGIRPAMSRKLEEVQDAILTRLWRERRQTAIEAFVAKLREDNKPEVHPELADLIKLEEPTAAVHGPGIPEGFPSAPAPAPAPHAP